ncbi:hypothetical protein [Sulfitobacter mediterraneus]|uniref:hypothetical protein n=1 Tax=Sulfitobacter mediterraneus TaxID=83219 RepID=UPI0021A70C22|nr:hypothetical protein [Sulfitobacter mediterraneus]UWR12346.1 hypothetical protein K3753_05615 [Sulfitobacter mediterraneus]
MNKHIPLLFADPEYHKGLDPEHLCLSYSVQPIRLHQQRFENLLVAEPAVNLSHYEINAVFDWLEIFVQIKGRQPATNIQSSLKRLNKIYSAFHSSHVKGPSRETGHFGEQFVIKMQDPRPKGLRLLLRALMDQYCSEGMEFDEIPLTGLELSLDVYPARKMGFETEAYEARRMLMTEVLRKHIFVHAAHRQKGRRPRFTFVHPGASISTTENQIKASKREIRAKLSSEEYTSGIAIEDLASQVPSLHTQAFLDGTFYFGKKNERLFYRCMDKIDNERNGTTAIPLPLKETRSRIELTFIDEVSGDGKGPTSADLISIDHIATRRLAGFNDLLIFGIPTISKAKTCIDEPNEEEWEVFSKSGVAGLSLMHDVREEVDAALSGKPLKGRKALLSTGKFGRYSALNRRVAKAFKALGHRWHRDW